MNNAQVLIIDEEINRYQEAVKSFLDNKIDADRFQSMRLQQGVYGQRQEGVNMIRVKIPGGIFNPEQVVAIADVLDQYAKHDVVHITTRQDIQIHYVPLQDTPAALKILAKAGLTTREACNNTVRNVTACPLVGICPHEHADIRPHVDGAVAHFLRHPLTQHLPRKFKISFSACETDCAQGLMHDIGVVAVNNNGQYGFKVMAGGGLGHKPRHAVVVEEFIEEKYLLASMEAIIALHNRYSDRKKRAKSRIKFLVDKFGAEGFVEKYKEEYARTKPALADIDYPKGQWTGGVPNGQCGPGAPRKIFAQKQPGLSIFPISIPIGDIDAPQLRGIAKLMNDLGLQDVRTTQDQNLILVDVKAEQIDPIRKALASLKLGEPQVGDDVVVCPGTSTCRLGITSSKIIGPKINGSAADLRIRASGCHNGCAQPETGDIGIYGEGKRLFGKLIPHYQMYVGGNGQGDGSIGMKCKSVPSARVESAITLIQNTYADDHQQGESFFKWSQAKGKEYFNELLTDIAKVNEDEVQSVLNDHGVNTDFKVLQFGGGECAGAAQETVAANFADAANERNYRNAFLLQRKYPEAMECAEVIARRVGQSLSFLGGQKPEDSLQIIAQQIVESLTENSEMGKQLDGFSEQLSQLKDSFDTAQFSELAKAMDAWTVQAAEICQNIDQQLDLTTSVSNIASANSEKKTAEIIDLTAFGCPLHYIKARNELRKFHDGDIIEFLFTGGESAEQVSSSLKNDGHQILAIDDQGISTLIRIRKTG